MPDIAIPDPHLSDHLPTQVLELTEDFAKADWMALGYTHYEVWCIGAAGGLGGGVLSDPIWATKFYLLSAPSDIWAGHLAALVQGDAYLGKKFYSDYYTTIFSSVPLSMPHGYLSLASPATGYTGGYAYDVTHYQAEEHYNPSHLLGVQEYMSVFARQTGDAFGGAGGGGGLHVVSGELEDLPEVCEVVVGQVGTDGDPGQIKANGCGLRLRPRFFPGTSEIPRRFQSTLRPRLAVMVERRRSAVIFAEPLAAREEILPYSGLTALCT
jgi:hypothetical protein